MGAADLTSIVGAFLTVCGVVLVVYQIRTMPPPHGHMQRANVGPYRFRISTAYPGMVMICIGAVLLIVGALARH
jgi:hypothetical protein